MVDLNFENTLTSQNSRAALIHRNSRADSALYSRDEATSKISDDLGVRYGMEEFVSDDFEKEQIYENLASIMRKTRQLSEASRKQKDKAFGVLDI